MHADSKTPFPTRLWVASLAAILVIVAVGIIVSRSESHPASPIALRLAAAAIVTALAAVAKYVGGPRAAAATAVAGTFVAVVLLIGFA